MSSISEMPANDGTAPPGTDLVDEMRRQWHRGHRVTADQLLAAHPELYDQPEAAVDLVYEEYCLRQSAGDVAGLEDEFLRRFPRWAGPLRLMFDCHRQLLRPPPDDVHYPAVGDRVEDFRILSELARGAHSRVFLAAQMPLADRPVVLKVTPLHGREHQALARLQHTHIVPLHSVLDDPARGLRILCMPCFGRATLASLLEAVQDTPHADRTGSHVLGAIDRAADPAVTATEPRGPVREMLAGANYAQAACWIGACIADALHFAHERGLVHLDLKPSNVLLAADAQPLLLDFHLAREPLRAGAPGADHFGGTPAYMPPEQRAAMRALERGEPVPEAVDRRADVYSLGAILYELLGGSLPRTASAPPLTRTNPQVSRGLADVIDKAMAPRAVDRYPDAAALADDLRRHLTDQPLASVANRSLAERWRKWRRRRPGDFPTAALVVALVLASGLLLAGLRLREQLAAAARVELARQLHRAAEDVRALYCADDLPPQRLDAVTRQCESMWARRDAVLRSVAGSQVPDLRADLQDIAVCTASLELRAADEAGSGPARHHALRRLDEAEAAFGRSAVIELERADAPLRQNMSTSSPRTAWEHTAVGRALLRRGQLTAASAELRAAIALDPAGRWCNFYYGICAARQGQPHDAVAAFSVAIGTGPDVPEFFHNRALAYRALGRFEEARRDSDRAGKLRHAR